MTSRHFYSLVIILIIGLPYSLLSFFYVKLSKELKGFKQTFYSGINGNYLRMGKTEKI